MDRPLTTSEKAAQAKKDPYKRKDHKEGTRVSYRFLGTLALYFIFTTVFALLNNSPVRNDLSDYESRGLAPTPTHFKGPVIQVYAARTWGLKGNFAVHTWLAYKEYASKSYQVAQVIGWRQHGNGSAVFVEGAIADKSWWGNEPMLLLDLREEAAEALIPKVKAAIDAYPWSNEYVVYPGPNSNTFVSWIGQQVPELKLDLPATAIGKDWRPLEQSFRDSPSGTGVTASLLGLLGFQLGTAEGLEINVLGLHFEADILDQEVGLPLIGTVSMWWVLIFLISRCVLSVILKRNNLDYIRINSSEP